MWPRVLCVLPCDVYVVTMAPSIAVLFQVAHAFVLGTKYSEVFKAAFTDKDNQEK